MFSQGDDDLGREMSESHVRGQTETALLEINALKNEIEILKERCSHLELLRDEIPKALMRVIPGYIERQVERQVTAIIGKPTGRINP